jgi:hypothetical protein
VRNEQRDPGQQTEDGGEVDKVSENGLGVVGGVHEGGAAKQRRDRESRNRDTALVGPPEDLGSVTLLGQAVDCTGSDVQIGIGGTEGEDQDTGVEDIGESLDACKLDGDDEGRGRRTSPSLGRKRKLWRVVGDKHAQEEDREAVKEQDSVEGKLDRTGNSLAGVLRLADSDTDKLSTQVGKDGVDQRAPETVKPASVTLGNVFLESAGFRVVLEGQKDNADDGYDLEGAEPELKFTKELNTKVVDSADYDEEDQDPYARIDSFRGYPFLNNERRSSQLVGSRDDIFAPISPAKSETESRIAEASSVASETRAMRNPSSHLTESCHDDIDEETNCCVSDEDGCRTVSVNDGHFGK